MENPIVIKRVKLSLGNRNKNSMTNDAHNNVLKTIMSLIHNGGMMHFNTSNPSEENLSYNIKGMRFDHEMDSIEIILQKI